MSYLPISCDLYDELSNASVLNQQVIITTSEYRFEGKITDIFTKDKIEYCTISYQQIRLDHILSFCADGKSSKFLPPYH